MENGQFQWCWNDKFLSPGLLSWRATPVCSSDRKVAEQNSRNTKGQWEFITQYESHKYSIRGEAFYIRFLPGSLM